jgi:hypothetical protein
MKDMARTKTVVRYGHNASFADILIIHAVV